MEQVGDPPPGGRRRRRRKAPSHCHSPPRGVPRRASVSLQHQAGGGGHRAAPVPHCSCHGGGSGVPPPLSSPTAAPDLPPRRECRLHLPPSSNCRRRLCLPGPPQLSPLLPPQPPSSFQGGAGAAAHRGMQGTCGMGALGTLSAAPRGARDAAGRGSVFPPLPPSPGTGSSQAPAAALAAWLRCGGGSCAGSSRSCPQMSPCPQGAAELNAVRAAAPASPHAGSERAASLPAGKRGVAVVVVVMVRHCRHPARHRPHATHTAANTPRRRVNTPYTRLRTRHAAMCTAGPVCTRQCAHTSRDTCNTCVPCQTLLPPDPIHPTHTPSSSLVPPKAALALGTLLGTPLGTGPCLGPR